MSNVCTLSAPLLVANSILNRAFSEKKPISHLKLQKLIYFVYKRFLQETHLPLFDEYFEVWTYGPVLRSVYDAFKDYGSGSIGDYAYGDNDKVFLISEKHADFYEALDWVWKDYGSYDAFELSDLTHRESSAWQKSKDADELLIDDDLIMSEGWFR